MDSNRKNLRTTLKDSLIENLLFNERRQKDSLKLFEISDIYSNKENIFQQKKLGVIVSGRCAHNYEDFAKKLDSKYLNKILNQDNNVKIFNIEEIPRGSLKTKKRDKIFYTEIPIEDIPDKIFKGSIQKRNKINFIKYNPISEFPSSTRDFSFSIKKLEQYDNVISIIKNFNNQNLKDSFIFDFYLNEKLAEIKVGVRLIFQSHTKTLSDEEIQKSIDDVLKPIFNLGGGFVPGLDF